MTMSTVTRLNQSDITDRLPHKHENVLLDSIQYNESDNSVTLSLTIPNNDPLHRQIFTERLQTNQPKTIISTVFTEIMALASIVHASPLPPNTSVFFASITDFELHQNHIASQPLTGKVTHTLTKRNFVKYKGHLTTESNQPIASATVMAIYTDSQPSTTTTTDQPNQLPPQNCDVKTDQSHWHRDNQFIVSDRLILSDPTTGSFSTEYTYPIDHPLTRGHFPDLPVMMGVQQWLGVADACLTHAHHTNQSGHNQRTVNATIYKSNGTIVSEISDCTVRFGHNTGDSPDYAYITKTKKVAFKQMVVPGETIIIHVTTDLPK